MTNMRKQTRREAEICYASVAMVTDSIAGTPATMPSRLQDIIRVLNANAGKPGAGRALARDFPRSTSRARSARTARSIPP